MAEGRASLGKLRAAVAKSRKADPGVDAGAGAAVLQGCLWGLMHALAGGAWYGALGYGLLATVSVIFGGAVISGVLEDSVGQPRAGVVGMVSALSGAALFSLRGYPPWGAALVGLPALAAFGFIYRRARATGARILGVEAALAADFERLPEDLDPALQARLDAALACHADLLSLAGELPAERAGLEQASATALRALAQQARILHRLTPLLARTPSLAGACESARGALDAIEAEQLALLEAVGLALTAQQSDQRALLRERAAQLRLSAAALAEIAAEVER